MARPDDNREEIRKIIKTDRQWLASVIRAQRYTEEQGIDAEMASFNDGLEAAVKIVLGGHQ